MKDTTNLEWFGNGNRIVFTRWGDVENMNKPLMLKNVTNEKLVVLANALLYL